MPTDAERIEALERQVQVLSDRLDWTMFGVQGLIKTILTVVDNNGLKNTYIAPSLKDKPNGQFHMILAKIDAALAESLKEQGVK